MLKPSAVPYLIFKQAEGGKMPDPRRYFGLDIPRPPTPADTAMFESEKSKLFPTFIKSPGDPLTADMSSPGKGALLYGTLAEMVGSIVGKKAGHLAGKLLPEKNIDEGKVGMYTGMTTAVLAAMAVWLKRHKSNENLEDLTLRLTPGSTRRDMENNPYLDTQDDPEAIRRIAQLNAALRGAASAARMGR